MKPARSVALTGLTLAVCALTFDSSPLLVVAVALVLLGTLTPLWVRASAHGARVRRRLPVQRAVEDQPLEAIIDIRRGPLGLPGAEVHDPLAGVPVAIGRPLSLLGGDARAQVRVLTRMHRRGLHRLEPPSLIVRDPLGLACARRIDEEPAQELLILPRTEPVRWAMPAGEQWWQADLADGAGEPLAAVDVDGLRPYREGAPASRIHWPALARTGVLLERRLTPEGDTQPLIVLDPRGHGAPELLDAAVRATASLTLALGRRGGCRLLLPGDRRPLTVGTDLSRWPAVHARLALVTGGPAARPPALSTATTQSGLLYVAAQTIERLPATLASSSRRPALVLPSPLPGPPGARAGFEVSGCRGYLLGSRPGAGRAHRVRPAEARA